MTRKQALPVALNRVKYGLWHGDCKLFAPIECGRCEGRPIPGIVARRGTRAAVLMGCRQGMAAGGR